MIFPALNPSETNRFLSERFAGRQTVPGGYEIGSGSRDVWDRAVAELRTSLGELLAQYQSRDPLLGGPEFDSHAAVALHRAVPIEDRIAGDDDFWRYLSCVEMFDAITWRHKAHDDDKPPHVDHFGLGGRWECFPKRLWFRAELSRDPSKTDPYELTRRGGMDFWSSGMLRVLYSCSRPLARALVRYQFPREGVFERGGMYRPQTLTTDGVRELYKRLQHFNATLSLPGLGDEPAAELVRSLGKDLEANYLEDSRGN